MIDGAARALSRAARHGLSGALAALLLSLMASLPGAVVVARAEVGPNAIKKKIEGEYPVTVLKTEPGTQNGQKVYRVTVMNRGGDFNEAFQVTTLIVDAETGKMLSQFRHGESGYRKSGAWDRHVDRPTEGPRGRIWR